MLKQLSRSPIVPAIVGTFIWAYMMLMAHTLRWRMEGAEHAEGLWRQKGPFIVVSWHSRIFLMPSIHMKFSEGWGLRPFPNTLMVSASRDGAFSKRSADLMKLHVVRGSAQTPGKTKDKRGYLGAREAMQAMSKGAALFLTVDGPKGPREHVGVGAIKLAQQMKAPILIYGVSAGGKRLKTWDRLVMALPYARGGVVFEEPIQTDKGMDTEALRALVERRLMAAIARADQLSGLGPDPIPAPAVDTTRASVAPSEAVAANHDSSTVEPAGS